MTSDELIAEAQRTLNPRSLSETAEAGGVAAALESSSGQVYTGVCIDTACSLGFCAEHAAIAAMITAGESHIRRVVAVGADGHVMPPCGRCRELMAQVDSENMSTEVLVSEQTSVLLRELLPYDWRSR